MSLFLFAMPSFGGFLGCCWQTADNRVVCGRGNLNGAVPRKLALLFLLLLLSGLFRFGRRFCLRSIDRDRLFAFSRLLSENNDVLSACGNPDGVAKYRIFLSYHG
jgi:hypothetical protein